MAAIEWRHLQIASKHGDDRYGARVVITACILAFSGVNHQGGWSLLAVRAAAGASERGTRNRAATLVKTVGQNIWDAEYSVPSKR